MIAGIFNDTLTLGDFEMIEMDEYHNFITKIKWVGTTGENEIAKKDEFIQVFPNPATDQIEIILTKDDGILYLELMDKYGRKVLTKGRIRENNQFTIDISNLSAGLYFIYFYTMNKEIISKKIIIN